MFRPPSCTFRIAFATIFLLSILGCGPRMPAVPRSIVRGNVTFQGAPVLAGQIRFLPAHGPTAQTQILNGQYLLDFKGGVAIGKCRVEIDAFEESGRELVMGVGGKTEKQIRQILPAKFNTKSILTVEVTAGSENIHDFPLKALPE